MLGIEPTTSQMGSHSSTIQQKKYPTSQAEPLGLFCIKCVTTHVHNLPFGLVDKWVAYLGKPRKV